MARIMKPPAALATPGRHLWTSCLRRDDSLAESDNPMRKILLDACRMADHIESMNGILSVEGLQVDSPNGLRPHPMLTELNRAMSLQARLIVALRMPDEQTGKKPQRRGLRAQGASKPGGTVSSLDRFQRAAGGA